VIKTDRNRYDERKEIFLKMLKSELGDETVIREVRPVLSTSDDWEIYIKKAGESKGRNIILSSELMTDENNDCLRKFKSQTAELKRQ